VNTPNPRRRRGQAQPPWQWTGRATAQIRDRTARPETDDEHTGEASPPPSRDTTANTAAPAAAADRGNQTAAEPLDIDRPEPEWPGSEWPEPEYPDPSWPGFAPGRRPPSYVITLAVSPWYKERYPDQAANLYDALRAGREHHHDPEPDLEAEP